MAKVLKIKIIVNDDPVALEAEVNEFLVVHDLVTQDFISLAHSCTTERPAQNNANNGLIHYTVVITYREEL